MTLEAVKSGVNLKCKGGSETRFLKIYCKQFKYNNLKQSTAFRPAVVLTRASSFCVSSVLWLLAVLLFVILYYFILVEPSLSWSPQLLPGMTSLLCPLPSTGVPAASLQWFTQCPLSPHSLSTAKCSALLAPSDLHASSFSLLHSVKGSLKE